MEDVPEVMRQIHEVYITFHPLFLFALNVVWQLWNDEALHGAVNFEWSKHFQVLWDSYAFPGDADARKFAMHFSSLGL